MTESQVWGLYWVTDDELTAVAQRRYEALCASFAQTWGEVFDSPRAAEIFNRAFEELDTSRQLLTWEGEGGGRGSDD